MRERGWRRDEAPPEALAVATWRTPASCVLDLRYAPDEAQWLSPAPQAVWADLLQGSERHGANLVAAYPVDDPYGGERAAAAVSTYFGAAVAPRQLTFAAGVTSLLHSLADLAAAGGPVIAPMLVHPDLPVWARARRHRVQLVDEPATADRLRRTIEDLRPSVVHLDRPDFAGAAMPLTELRSVVQAASQAGATVVVDESPAAYLGPEHSAAQLLAERVRLVVLRGFTKAYSLGGLRCGFALASTDVADRVRQVVPPMQTGELALHTAIRLLSAGDIVGGLRARIRSVKPRFVARLRAAGLSVREGHEDVSWVSVSDHGGATSGRLAELGIQGLRPSPTLVEPGPSTDLLHLTVPLSDERIRRFETLTANWRPRPRK